MDQSVVSTFIYASVGGLVVLVGFFIKHYISGLDATMTRLNASVDSISKIVADMEARLQLHEMRLDMQDKTIDELKEMFPWEDCQACVKRKPL